jgi:hypothetical protein
MNTKLFALFAAIGSFAGLFLIPTTAEALDNSWSNPGGHKWEIGSNWSLGVPPANTQGVVGITNVTTKTVTIDAATVLSNGFNGCMTISNLTVSGPPGTINTLQLTNAGVATPLTILSAATISSGGVLLLTNSAMLVAPAGGTGFVIDGSVMLTNDSSVIVSNGNTIVGNTGSGSLTVFGSSLTVSNLVVANLSGSHGTITFAGGTNRTTDATAIGLGTGSAGAMWIKGGLVQPSVATFSVGTVGSGQLILSNGTFRCGFAEVAATGGSVGTLTVAGGTWDGPGNLNVGEAFNATGTVWITGGTVDLTSLSFFNTIGSGGGIGRMTVSNGLVSASFLNIGQGIGVSRLTMAGGTNTVYFGMKLGTPLCSAVGNAIVNGGALFVTNAAHNAVVEVRSGSLELDSGTLSIDTLIATNACASFIQTGGTFLSTGTAQVDQGTQTVASGIMISSNVFVGSTPGTTGTFHIVGGSLLVTNVIGIANDGTTTGSGGVGSMTISNATVTTGSVLLGSTVGGQGSLVIQLGAVLNIDCRTVDCKLSTNDGLLDGGTINAPNALLSIGENHVSTVTISNGVATFQTASVGFNNTGSLTMPGGTMTVLSNMVVGDCGANVTGIVTVTGGALYVTNAAHNAVLDVRGGQFLMTGGTVVADRLVMTNACGLFVRYSGTTSFGSMTLDSNLSAVGDGIPNGWKQQHGLDPFDSTLGSEDTDGDGFSNLQEFLAGTDPTNSASAFRIISITQQGTTNRVTWMMGAGKTNALQATAGGNGGSYSSTDFADIFTVTNTVGSVTNYPDPGGATNKPARYYRARLVP